MDVLGQMETIRLEEAKAVRLMNRMERKYVASAGQLKELLERVADRYLVQQVDGNRVASYSTLYFDTDDLAMYTMHHNGKLNRQKLRVRTYRLTDTAFFEIKNKDNKGRTSKRRIPVDVTKFEHVDEVPEVREFVETYTPYNFNSQFSFSNSLHACLENMFERITLVNKGLGERVTIDGGISFCNRATGRDADIGGLLVVEVKQEAGTPVSDIEKALHEMHILPRRMSKYCIGTALTDPSAKRNRFKPTLSVINHQLSINEKYA